MKFVAKILILFTISILFISLESYSQIAPKYSNEFMAIGVGARSFGMGNSVTASTNDITSVYWNPAGLNKIGKRIEIGAMHSEYFAGIGKYDFMGVSYKIDAKSAVGISMIRYAVDDIPDTRDLFDSEGNIQYDRISYFSVGDYAFMFSYARSMPIEGLDIGANIKLIRRNVGNFAYAWGFGFDISALYEYNNWKFGANLRDVTSTFNAWRFNLDELQDIFLETENEIPENGLELTLPRLVIGAGYMFKIKGKFTLYPEIGLVTTTDGKRNTVIKTNFISIDPSMGLELGYNDLVFARFGVSNFQKLSDYDDSTVTSWQPSIGLGIKYFGFKLDYAFADIGNQGLAPYSHVFSLAYNFDINTKK